jgi:hypothetical protein
MNAAMQLQHKRTLYSLAVTDAYLAANNNAIESNNATSSTAPSSKPTPLQKQKTLFADAKSFFRSKTAVLQQQQQQSSTTDQDIDDDSTNDAKGAPDREVSRTFSGNTSPTIKSLSLKSQQSTISSSKLLHIHLLEAYDLLAADASGTSDPFVKITTRNRALPQLKSSSHVKSRIINATCNPVFNEVFTLELPDYVDELLFQCYDHDRMSSDDCLGCAVLHLSDIMDHFASQNNKTAMLQWLPLSKSKSENNTSNNNTEQQGWISVGLALDDQFVLSDQRDTAEFIKRRQQLLAASLHRHQSSSSSSESLSVLCTTWNVGNAPPCDLTCLVPKDDCDLVAIGAQEANYSTSHSDTDNCTQDWLLQLTRHLGRSYRLIAYHSLWQTRLAVFCRSELQQYVSSIKCASEATGLGGVVANKATVCVSFMLKHTSFAFVTAHLAAHQGSKYIELRNDNVRQSIRNIKCSSAQVSMYNSIASDLLSTFDHIIWSGDLNYRLNYKQTTPQSQTPRNNNTMTQLQRSDSSLPQLTTDASLVDNQSIIAAAQQVEIQAEANEKSPSNELFAQVKSIIFGNDESQKASLFASDQLQSEQSKGNVFVGFTEGDYVANGIKPTFKVERCSVLRYTMQRLPAWTDRVLWRSVDDKSLRSSSTQNNNQKSTIKLDSLSSAELRQRMCNLVRLSL